MACLNKFVPTEDKLNYRQRAVLDDKTLNRMVNFPECFNQ
jgi:hypothetical protein